ncbi:hypothetical protein NF212_17375 [Parasalinivibrio latis]|uniref:hypothetical protein n=1 Tax=Parasalinivibrio latis TaxID=2952610 RepID=UPI0030E47E68
MKRLTVLVLSTVLSTTGCGEEKASGGSGSSVKPAPPPPTEQSGWNIQNNSLPVLSAGDHRAQALWGDPHVTGTPGSFRMYATTSTVTPFKAPILPFRFDSTDGVTWNLASTLPLVDVTSTSFASLETPSVVFFNSNYHMYLTAVYPENHSPPMEIVHAQSADGSSWTLTGTPVIRVSSTATDWNGYSVAEPAALVKDGKIWLYFSGVGPDSSGSGPKNVIGVAESSDGVAFSTPAIAHSPTARYGESKGYAGYSTPMAFEMDGKVHLVYDLASYDVNSDPKWQQVAILNAVEESPGNFKEADLPILNRGNSDGTLSWASGQVIGPTVVENNGTIHLWFGAHANKAGLADLINRGFTGNEFGIGYMTTSKTNYLVNLE